MRLKRFLILFLIFFLLPNEVNAQKVGLHPEDLNTLQDKIAYLKWVESNIDDFYTQAYKYDDDYFRVLMDQLKIQERLMQDAEYQKQIQIKKKLLEVKIEPAESTIQKNAQWDLDAAKNDAEKVKENFSSSKEIENRIRVVQSKIQNKSAQGMLSGLIQVLPPEERKNLGKTMESRVAVLEKSLPDVVPETFRGSEFGLTPPYSKKEVVEQFKLRVTLEEELQTLHLANSPDLEKTISEMKIAKYKIESPILEAPLVASVVNPISALKLQEVPVSLSIYRGCVGGDCSTQKSFMFTNATSEHVFFVQGKSGNKGYLQFSKVQVDGKPALYLHTINGAAFKKEEIKGIISALPEVAKSLDAEKVYLPNPARILKTVNFELIQKTMEESAKKEKTVHTIVYTDLDIRAKIEDFKSILGKNTSKNYTNAYDAVNANKGLRELNLALIDPKKIKVTITPKEISSMPLSGVNTDDQVKFLIMSKRHQNSEVVRNYAEQLNISYPDFIHFESALNHESGSSVSKWKEEVDQSYRKLTGQETPKVFKNILDQNIILSHDAFQPPNDELSVRVLSKYLDKFDKTYLATVDKVNAIHVSINKADQSSFFKTWLVQEMNGKDSDRMLSFLKFTDELLSKNVIQTNGKFIDEQRAFLKAVDQWDSNWIGKKFAKEMRTTLAWAVSGSTKEDSVVLKSLLKKMPPQHRKFLEMRMRKFETAGDHCGMGFLKDIFN